jgi:hypothetical protein
VFGASQAAAGCSWWKQLEQQTRDDGMQVPPLSMDETATQRNALERAGTVMNVTRERRPVLLAKARRAKARGLHLQ